MRQAAKQVGDVPSGPFLEWSHPTHGRAGGSIPGLVQPSLDRVLELVGQLVATPREELDAVVGHRVVRGRQHDTQVGAAVGDQEGDGGSRQHAGIQDIDPR